MARQVLVEILEARMEEILNLVNRELIRSGFDEFLSAGVVLTGGSSILDGCADLGERIFRYAGESRSSRWSRRTS